jgi:hypothetical protein
MRHLIPVQAIALHQVVAVSFVEAKIDRSMGVERYSVKNCRSGGEVHYDEQFLLKGFWHRFGKVKPRVVTWNGRGFDPCSGCAP